jgi:hypothetical protein
MSDSHQHSSHPKIAARLKRANGHLARVIEMIETGRLLRSAAAPEDRPALFAAQFTLSHACWLVTYPLSGWLLASHGLDAAGIGLFVLGCVGFVAALYLWRNDPSDSPANQT